MRHHFRAPTKRACQFLMGTVMFMLAFLVSESPGLVGQATAQTDCAALRTTLKQLEASRTPLETKLRTAAGEEKQALLRQIRELRSEIKKVQIKANQCNVWTWTVGRDVRQALVLPPEINAGEQGHPVVFAFHGHGGTMWRMAQQMPIQPHWPQAIVVYPQGLKRKKSARDTERYGWQKEAGDESGRDLKFFDAMLTRLRQKFNVDGDRIYVTGFSNGGAFSFLLWDERGEVIAALSECAGINHGHPVEPRPLLAIVGRRDKADPPENQQKTIDMAIAADNADRKGQLCDPPGGPLSGNTCLMHRSTTQTPVKTLFHLGGHEVPSFAAAESVAFFKNHKRL